MTVPFVKQAHNKVAEYLHEGDVVVDATMGNGFDTLFLAEAVGELGKVYAFDIQKNAITSTRIRLNQANVLQRVCLIHDSHANLAIHLKNENIDSIQCAMFNLGYLPGSDKVKKTSPESTIKSLETVIKLLSKHGVISVLAYTGHPGGREEAESVKGWAKSLPSMLFNVTINKPALANDNSPEWIVVEYQ